MTSSRVSALIATPDCGIQEAFPAGVVFTKNRPSLVVLSNSDVPTRQVNIKKAYHLQPDRLLVSEHGVPHGLIAKRLGKNIKTKRVGDQVKPERRSTNSCKASADCYQQRP
jgi:hypothetical protein